MNDLLLREREVPPGSSSFFRASLYVMESLKSVLLGSNKLCEEEYIGIRWTRGRLVRLGHPLRC